MREVGTGGWGGGKDAAWRTHPTGLTTCWTPMSSRKKSSGSAVPVAPACTVISTVPSAAPPPTALCSAALPTDTERAVRRMAKARMHSMIQHSMARCDSAKGHIPTQKHRR